MKWSTVKRRAASIAGIFMLACLPFAAADKTDNVDPAIPQTLSTLYNRAAVGELYGQNCSSHDLLRKYNIRSPGDRQTPSAFSRDENRIALYSPYLSAAQVREAQNLIDSVPKHVLDIFYQQGGVFVFTSRTIAEAIPGATVKIDGKYPYFESFVGLYRGEERRAFVTFNLAEVEDGQNGPVVKKFSPVVDSKVRIINHEAGHFIDHMLSVIGKRGSAYTRFSSSPEFQSRVKRDLVALSSRNLTRAQLSRYSYYLPERFNNKDLFGSKDNAYVASPEIFAELWAEAQGKGNINLKALFPETFALVDAVNKDLIQLYGDNHVGSCSLNGFAHSNP